ncbi:hypothetical protein QFZ98_003802 [Paraburkholderia youngii]
MMVLVSERVCRKRTSVIRRCVGKLSLLPSHAYAAAFPPSPAEFAKQQEDRYKVVTWRQWTGVRHLFSANV